MRKFLHFTLLLLAILLVSKPDALAAPKAVTTATANTVEKNDNLTTATKIFQGLPVFHDQNQTGKTTHIGTGTITLTSNGWVIVQPNGPDEEQSYGFAMYVNRATANQTLYSQDGMMMVKQTNPANGTAKLTLNGAKDQEGRYEEVSFTGTLILSYNEKTGQMNVTLDAGAEGTFNENYVYAPPNGDPVPVPQSNCRCTYGQPNTPNSCTAQQENCPPGMYAKCTCNNTGCTATCLPVPKSVVTAT